MNFPILTSTIVWDIKCGVLDSQRIRMWMNFKDLNLAALRILKILPDSVSTLLKHPHLIPHIMVEIKLGSSFLPLPFVQLPRGGGRCQILKIHLDSEFTLMKTPTFDTPHDIRGQRREVHFCSTSSRPQNLENPSRFCIYTIKTPTFDTPHYGRDQIGKVIFASLLLP